jgi:ferritin-like metal-binding protein YciE
MIRTVNYFYRMEEEKKKAPKKVAKKVEKKEVKLDLSDKLLEIADFINKTVLEERGKKLNTSACAKLNKVKQDLIFTARNIAK